MSCKSLFGLVVLHVIQGIVNHAKAKRDSQESSPTLSSGHHQMGSEFKLKDDTWYGLVHLGQFPTFAVLGAVVFSG